MRRGPVALAAALAAGGLVAASAAMAASIASLHATKLKGAGSSPRAPSISSIR